MSTPVHDDLDHLLDPADRATGDELARRLNRVADATGVSTPPFSDVARRSGSGVSAPPDGSGGAVRRVVAVAAAVTLVLAGVALARRGTESPIAATAGPSTSVAPPTGGTPARLQLDPALGAVLQPTSDESPLDRVGAVHPERIVVYRRADQPFTAPWIMLSSTPWNADLGFATAPPEATPTTVGRYDAVVWTTPTVPVGALVQIGDRLVVGSASGLDREDVLRALASAAVADDGTVSLTEPPAGLTRHRTPSPEDYADVQHLAYALSTPPPDSFESTAHLWVFPDRPGAADAAALSTRAVGYRSLSSPTVDLTTVEGQPALRAVLRLRDGRFRVAFAWKDPVRNVVVLLELGVPSPDRADQLAAALVDLDESTWQDIRRRCMRSAYAQPSGATAC